MKLLKSIVITLTALAALGGFTACQDDFDTPELLVQPPKADIEPNTTILDLKKAFWSDAESNYATLIGNKENGEHYIIHGRVITTDYPGNIYKSLVIQDETAAIQFAINAYSLYQKYRIGQEIVIDVTGLYCGKYSGLLQIGAESHSSSGAAQTGYMSDQRFYSLAKLNGLPEPSKVHQYTFDNMSEIAADPIRWQSEVVNFTNVTFVPQMSNLNADGKYETIYTFGIYQENFNQKVKIDNSDYDLRTSGYSNFYYRLMPTEPCDAKLLCSMYNGSWQFQLIDYADITNVGDPTIAAGTEKNPWTIDQAIENITAGVKSYGWTKGYIVGTVAPEVTNVTSDADIEWGADATLANTVVIAPYADTKDFKSCLIVPLPQDSELRSAVALKNHPENLGKELEVQGTPEAYMGAFGISGNLGTGNEFKLEGYTPGGLIAEGDGNEATPYNPEQVIAMNPTSTQNAVATGVWVSGYIVGFMPTGGSSTLLTDAVFSNTDATNLNVVIAATADETNPAKCVGVQLPTAIRGAINLKENPGNLGKVLTIKGDVMKYCGGPGVKNGAEYKIEGSGSGSGDTPVNPGTPSGAGTEASPYNCAKIIELNPQSTTDATESGIWAEGYVVGYYQDYDAHFQVSESQRANILIADSKDCTDKTQTVCVQLVANTDARNALNLVDNPGVLGKKVQLKGDVMKYNTLPGIKNTSSYKIDGTPGGGDTPSTGDALWSATFKSGEDGFTIHDVSLAPELTYVWKHDSSYGYMKASAYNGQSYASNSWLVSPLLDLSAAKSPVLTFDHVTNKFPDLATAQRQVSLAVSVNGGDWQTVTIPEWSTNANWTFVNSGSISLAAYAGKKIKLGFHYTSENGVSGTWEVKNIAISGTGSITATADSSFPGGGDTPGGGGDDPVTPPTPSGDYKGDFDSFNGGEPKSSYGDFTNATGWTATGCNILGGLAAGGTDTNPRFAFIGGEKTLAVSMNGKTSKPGKITSPTLTGGIKTLTFKYGTAYSTSASKFSFTVKVLQNGSVVKETTMTPDMKIKTAYDFSWDVNVSGDFSIEIVNNCPSGKDSNVDRVAIWNLTWN